MMSARTIALLIPRSRQRSWAECGLVVVAFVATVARIGEIPGHPFVFVRVLFSVVAIAFLAFGPAASFGRRAISVVALEALFGIVTFAFVDAPFVIDHQTQIASFTTALVERLDRFEHGGM
jgi:purine-cytosine permease-like protein